MYKVVRWIRMYFKFEFVKEESEVGRGGGSFLYIFGDFGFFVFCVLFVD